LPSRANARIAPGRRPGYAPRPLRRSATDHHRAPSCGCLVGRGGQGVCPVAVDRAHPVAALPRSGGRRVGAGLRRLWSARSAASPAALCPCPAPAPRPPGLGCRGDPHRAGPAASAAGAAPRGDTPALVPGGGIGPVSAAVPATRSPTGAGPTRALATGCHRAHPPGRRQPGELAGGQRRGDGGDAGGGRFPPPATG
jgi:hypothetical protein